jgi:hypothetical protein
MTEPQKARSYLQQRKRAYAMAFDGVSGEAVLKDLASFCRANESCFHPDPRVHAVMEGRREVWLRIQEHLKLTEEQLLTIYTHSRKVSND